MDAFLRRLCDDIDDTALGIGPVKGGGGSLQHFDMVHRIHIYQLSQVGRSPGDTIRILSHAIHKNHHVGGAINIYLVGAVILGTGTVPRQCHPRHMADGLTHVIIVFFGNFLRRHHGHIGIGVHFLFRYPAGGDHDAIQGIHRCFRGFHRKSAAGKCKHCQ